MEITTQQSPMGRRVRRGWTTRPKATPERASRAVRYRGWCEAAILTGLLGVGLAGAARAQAPAEVVVRPSSVTRSSFPDNLVRVGRTVFFFATTPETGFELWTSDGTASGTHLIKDITPGADSAQLATVSDVNGIFFFALFKGTGGFALWKSDGTLAGTVLVKDLTPDPAIPPSAVGVFEPLFANVNGILFFTVYNGGGDFALWKSDGTPGGTVLVKDVNPGSNPYAYESSPLLTNVNGSLFFTTSDGGLWKSDGTGAGTVVVKKDVYAHNLTSINGTLFFAAYNISGGFGLWRSDGTPAGTVALKDIAQGSGVPPSAAGPFSPTFANVNGVLFLTAYNGGSGFELWRSDGTAAGTVRISYINPVGLPFSFEQTAELANIDGTLFFTGPDNRLWKSDGSPSGTVMVKNIAASALTNFNDTLLFAADDGTHGVEWWRTDGTEAGTVLVKDISPGNGNTFDRCPVVPRASVDGSLLFAADDGTHGCELWKTDGTADGTVLVKDINPTYGGPSPGNATRVNDTLFFTADDGIHGLELWKDTPTTGAVLVKDINPGSGGSSPAVLTAVNGSLFFTADDGTHGVALWKSDGTTESTVVVAMPKDISGDALSEFGTSFVSADNTLFFTVVDFARGLVDLWKSDGTTGGTVLVKNIVPANDRTIPAFPLFATSVNSTLFLGVVNYFELEVNGAPAYELWLSDGTAGGTILLSASRDSIQPPNATDVNGTAFFTVDDGIHGSELWKNTSTAGAVPVKDINPGSGSSSPYALTAVNDTLYFAADDGTHGPGLWRSNGAPDDTVLVRAFSSLGPPIDVRGTLFFLADDGTHGAELWKSDGTPAGTVLVADINPGRGNSNPLIGTDVNGILFFVADDGIRGPELWKSDGSAAGTVLVEDINPGSSGSSPSNLTNVDGMLYFAADDGTNGVELWKSDGTAAARAADIFPGPASSNPTALTVVGNALFFSATGDVVGPQLWRLPNAGTCGNGVVDSGEACDDGNLLGGDRCDPTCTPTGCGNGFASTGEECDDGNTNDTDACTNACTLNACGDGAVSRLFEQCDDGNTINGDGCNADCTFTCAGDCGGDGQVTVDELLKAVNIALGNGQADQCASADLDRNGQVNVDELLIAVAKSLNGCL